MARRYLMSVATCLCIVLAGGFWATLATAYKPEGEMRWALYVTISPAWLDPAEVAVSGLNSFWFCYALHGNAATCIEEVVISTGVYVRGGYPDIDALFKQQDNETDRTKREALLHQIQQLMHERVMFAPIWLYIWPSGIGPRVEDPALMSINPYPWSAPLEDVRLKQS